MLGFLESLRSNEFNQTHGLQPLRPQFSFVKMLVGAGVLSPCFRLWQHEVVDIANLTTEQCDADMRQYFAQRVQKGTAEKLAGVAGALGLDNSADELAVLAALGEFYEDDIQLYQEESAQAAEEYHVQFPFLTGVEPKLIYQLAKILLPRRSLMIKDVAAAGSDIDRQLSDALEKCNAPELPQDLLCGCLQRDQLKVLLQFAARHLDENVMQIFVFLALREFWESREPAHALIYLLEQLPGLSPYCFASIFEKTCAAAGVFFEQPPIKNTAMQTIQKMQLQEMEAEIICRTLTQFHARIGTQIGSLLEQIQVALQKSQEREPPQGQFLLLMYEAKRIKDLLVNVMPVADGFLQTQVDELCGLYQQLEWKTQLVK